VSKVITLPYAPLPKQQEAHGLEAKYRGFCGGWGNGKTSWGCMETFLLLTDFPGITFIVARKTRPELKSTTWDMLMNGDASQPTSWHGIPKETIDFYNKSDLHLKLRNGSQVYGLPLDDPKKLENYNLGGFWVDQAEEIEEDIFLKFHGRLRQLNAPRMGLLTFNPNGHNWLWKRFIDPKRPHKWKKNYKCVEATPFDNPNLPDDYMEQFEGLPEAWYQRFVEGSHEVFVGQIFTDWDPNVHVVQPFRIPSNWERWSCIDPGIRHEGCVSWMARDLEGNAYYYRELLTPNQTVAWWANEVHKAEAEDDLGGPYERIWRRIIGSEAVQRGQTDGKTVISEFHEHGIFPELSDRDPSARISRITEYLRPQSSHVNPFNGGEPAPRLYVFSSCEKLLEYLPQYRWRPQRTNFSEEDAPEKPRKKDDHNIDNLGHILLACDDLPPVEVHQAPPGTEREHANQHFDQALEQANRESAISSGYAAALVGGGSDEPDGDDAWANEIDWS
jgi:hypothetical protein